MVIVARAVYEKGVLYLTEELDLPENKDVLLTIQPLSDADEAGQETLTDVLGFDPADEQKMQALAESQHHALKELIENTRSLPGSEPPHDGARNHDKYIYRLDR